MLYFWILVIVLACLVVYGLDQQFEFNAELTNPRKLVVRLIIWVLKLGRQTGRNIVREIKLDLATWLPRDGLKKRKQDSE